MSKILEYKSSSTLILRQPQPMSFLHSCRGLLGMAFRNSMPLLLSGMALHMLLRKTFAYFLQPFFMMLPLKVDIFFAVCVGRVCTKLSDLGINFEIPLRPWSTTCEHKFSKLLSHVYLSMTDNPDCNDLHPRVRECQRKLHAFKIGVRETPTTRRIFPDS